MNHTPSQRSLWAEGQAIGELMGLPLARPQLISLAAGFVDQQSLPVEVTRTALEALLRDPAGARASLQYGSTPGHPPLRELLLERQLRQDGLEAERHRFDVERVVCTAGSNQLLQLLGECLFDPGDIVLCAAPTYLVILGTFRSLGVRAIGLETDDEGIVPESMDATLRQLDQRGELSRVKAIYVVSDFDNPRGLTLTAGRRQRIVELAKQWSHEASSSDRQNGRIMVIDDAAYRELRYTGEDVPSLLTFDEEQDTVVVAGTFSKPFSPGIRVGWGILPEALIDPVNNVKANVDFGSPNFNQHLMAKILELELFDAHVEEIRSIYRSKLDTMLAAMVESLSEMEGCCWKRPDGGLYVWLQLPDSVDAGPSGSLLSRSLDEGVFYVPGEYCFAEEGEPTQKNAIRLSFGVQDQTAIRRGIQALARAVSA